MSEQITQSSALLILIKDSNHPFIFLWRWKKNIVYCWANVTDTHHKKEEQMKRKHKWFGFTVTAFCGGVVEVRVLATDPATLDEGRPREAFDALSPSRETSLSNRHWRSQSNRSWRCVTQIASTSHTHTRTYTELNQPASSGNILLLYSTCTHCNESLSQAFASCKHHAGTQPEANKAGAVREHVGQASEE